MYGKLNAILRSKAALWSITLFAILLFCVTATFAFGMGSGKKDGNATPQPAEKIPSTQPKESGLQVLNSSGDASPTQLQGQSGNGSVSQPAAPSSTAPNAGLDASNAASQAPANGSAAVGPASTSLSASLQPSAVLGGSGGTNAQADLNALGANANLNTTLP